MKLEPKQFVQLLQADHQRQLAQQQYLILMAVVGLDGTKPVTFNIDTFEVTPVTAALPDPPLAQAS